MATSQDVLGAFLSLEKDDQFLLMEQLLDRLSPEADDLGDDELAAELERRRKDFERDTADEIPWSVLRGED